MPKVKLGKPYYERIFGSKLKASVIGSGNQCKSVARYLGICAKTLSDRYRNPAQMTLGELKLLIRMTDMPPDDIIQYLYEGKAGRE